MKNLRVFPTFMVDVANGFGLIKLEDIPALIKAHKYENADEVTKLVIVTNDDDFDYYCVKYGTRTENGGEFPYLVVANPNDPKLFKVVDVANVIKFGKKSIKIKTEMEVEFKINIKSIAKIYEENSWRLGENPKNFFESEALNSINLQIGYTMLHAHANHMRDNFVYGLFNEAMNTDMISGVTEWMYDRWLADCENDEFYDDDLLGVKICEVFNALTTADNKTLNVEYRGDLGLYIEFGGKTFVYNVKDNCDSEIYRLRDLFLTEVNK